jgi:hypothetical protein
VFWRLLRITNQVAFAQSWLKGLSEGQPVFLMLFLGIQGKAYLMGQGGTLVLVNGTPYDWKNVGQSAYQMNSWTFPDIIPARSVASVYVERSEGVFQTVSDDSAQVTYALSGTTYSFDIRAGAPVGFDLRAVFTNIETEGNPRGSTVDLGWNWNGVVNFVLGGQDGSFVSTNPPCSWMSTSLGWLGGRPLRHICMPGSHDSGMSVFTSGTAFAFPCSTLSQTSGILGQLQFGVRYFDIRPVISGGQFYTGHYSFIDKLKSWQGANGQSIASVISDVNSFTASNRELVILYLSHDLNTDLGNSSYAGFTQDQWNLLLTQLQQGLKCLFVKNNPSGIDLTQLTLNDYIGGGASVVVIVDSPTVDLGKFYGQGFFNPGNFAVYNQYSNTNVLAQMQSDQISKLKQQRPGPDSGYFLLSWTLTQNDVQASTCALGTADSVLDLAATANPSLFQALLPACNSQTYPNIIYVDGVHGSDVAALGLAINGLAS